jgi:hypothetical protein
VAIGIPSLVGVFDGIHLGHRHVIDRLVATGLTPTVMTFDPHPRLVLGYGVELLTTLERRLELLAGAGVEETLVLEFSHELQQLEPEAFVERISRGPKEGSSSQEDFAGLAAGRSGVDRAAGNHHHPGRAGLDISSTRIRVLPSRR